MVCLSYLYAYILQASIGGQVSDSAESRMQANYIIFPSKQRYSVQKAVQRGPKHRNSSVRDFVTRLTFEFTHEAAFRLFSLSVLNGDKEN